MLEFIREDIAQLAAYTPHPGGKSSIPIDRLDTNESPLDLPPQLKEKLAGIYQQHLETNRYPDGSHEVLKSAIADYVNESANLEQIITSENISVGNGSDELIRSLLIATCIGGKGSVLVANPTFSMYRILAQTLGIPVVSIPRDEQNFSINLSAAEKAIKQSHQPPVKVVFMVHPNSPTGNLVTEAEWDWLRSLGEDVLVVIDEAYFEFSQTSMVGELAKHPNWLILRTFSKAFRLASLRVGYAVGHGELIMALEKIRLPYNLPGFSQVAAELVLSDRQLILSYLNETLSERERLYKILSQEVNCQAVPSAANFLYLKVKNPEEITTNLKSQGTLIRHTGGGLRITIGTMAENNRMVNRLQTFLAV